VNSYSEYHLDSEHGNVINTLLDQASGPYSTLSLAVSVRDAVQGEHMSLTAFCGTPQLSDITELGVLEAASLPVLFSVCFWTCP